MPQGMTAVTMRDQPKKKKRARKHGFKARMSSKPGRNVLKNRRAKKRKKLAV